MSGMMHGIDMQMIDTPGLSASASGTATNAAVLLQIRKAFKRHKPDLVVYVDRLDLPRQHEVRACFAVWVHVDSYAYSDLLIIRNRALSGILFVYIFLISKGKSFLTSR